MGTRLPRQERAQSLSVPIMSIQIHKNDWPGASLQGRGKQTSQIKHCNSHLVFVTGNSRATNTTGTNIISLHIGNVKVNVSPAKGILKSNQPSFPQNHIIMLLICSIYQKNHSFSEITLGSRRVTQQQFHIIAWETLKPPTSLSPNEIHNLNSARRHTLHQPKQWVPHF